MCVYVDDVLGCVFGVFVCDGVWNIKRFYVIYL